MNKNWKHIIQITDSNIILVKGQLVFEGLSQTLLDDPCVLEQYLGVWCRTSASVNPGEKCYKSSLCNLATSKLCLNCATPQTTETAKYDCLIV